MMDTDLFDTLEQSQYDIPRVESSDYTAAMETMDTPFHRWAYQIGMSKEFLSQWHVGGKGSQTIFHYALPSGEIANLRRGAFNEKGALQSTNMYFLKNGNPTIGKKYEIPLYGLDKIEEGKTICLVTDEVQCLIGAWKAPKYTWLSYSGINGLSDEKVRSIDKHNIYLVRTSNSETTGKAQRRLQAQKVNFKVVDFWKNISTDKDETIVDLVLAGKTLEIGFHASEPEVDDYLAFLQHLDDKQQQDVLEFGFYQKDQKYYFRTGENSFSQKSNFIMVPLYHVKATDGSKRLIELINDRDQNFLIDAPTEAFISVGNFRKVVEDKGNVIWWGSLLDLDKIKQKIYNQFKTAFEVSILGWQPEGFFAWANGATDQGGRFHNIDDYGMVPMGDVHFFIPALSAAYRNERQQQSSDDDIYSDDRLFIFSDKQNITIKEWFDQFMRVHGEHGMVGLAFFFAALFRDHIYNIFKSFPHLFLYGKPGSGKSSLALSLTSMFGVAHKPYMLNGGTDVAFYRRPCQYNNAITWYDEYSASIDANRKEGLKNFYDGSSREVGQLTRSTKTKKMPVRSAVCISGQEFPDNNALFTRCVLRQFAKIDYSENDKLELAKLRKIEDELLSHITAQLLTHRAFFEKHFYAEFEKVSSTFRERVSKKTIDHARIFNSYQILITTMRVMSRVITLPFSLEEFENVMYKSLEAQTVMVADGNETREFWDMMEYLIGCHEITEQVDFEILPYMKNYSGEVYKAGQSIKLEWKEPRSILVIQFSKIYGKYAIGYRAQKGKTGMGKTVLKDYLTTEDTFLGLAKAHNFSSGKRTSAYLFDYTALENKGVNLESPPEVKRGSSPEPPKYDEKLEAERARIAQLQSEPNPL